MTDWLEGVAQLQLSPLAQWVASQGPKSPVLDVSTPPGVVAQALAKEGCEVVCVTPRPAVVSVLADRFAGGSEVVEVKAGEVANLPQPSESVGAVIAFGPDLEGAPLESALDEFARVLTPGGLLVAAPETTSGSTPARLGSRDLEALEKAASIRFEHVAVVELSYQMVATLAPCPTTPVSTVAGNTATPEKQEGAAIAVVVASSGPLPPIGGSFVAMSPPAVERWLGESNRLLSDLRAAEATAASASRAKSERDLLLQELFASEQSLAEFYNSSMTDGTISPGSTSAHVELMRSRLELRETKKLNSLLNARVEELLASTSWRVTEPLRRMTEPLRRLKALVAR